MTALLVIVGIVFLVAFALWSVRFKDVEYTDRNDRTHTEKRIDVSVKRAAVGASVMLAYFALVVPSFGTVSPGHRGVVIRLGHVTGKVLGEGLYFITPLVDSVVQMNVQVQAPSAAAGAASQDLQTVRAKIVVNYALAPKSVARIYRTLREDYEGRVIEPFVQEVIRDVTARFTAEQLITQRQAVNEGIQSLLRRRLVRYGITVASLSITNFSFSEAFERAIEAKVTAEQEALQAKNVVERVRQEARQKVVRAEADAEARLAVARAEAEAIRLQRLQLTPEYISFLSVQKWNGVMPGVIAGSATPFISVPSGR